MLCVPTCVFMEWTAGVFIFDDNTYLNILRDFLQYIFASVFSGHSSFKIYFLAKCIINCRTVLTGCRIVDVAGNMFFEVFTATFIV